MSLKLSIKAKKKYYKNNYNMLKGGSNNKPVEDLSHNYTVVGYFFTMPSNLIKAKKKEIYNGSKIIDNNNFFLNKYIVWFLVNTNLLPKYKENKPRPRPIHIPFLYLHGTRQEFLKKRSFNHGLKNYIGTKNGLFYTGTYLTPELSKGHVYSERLKNNNGVYNKDETYPIILAVSDALIYVEKIPLLHKTFKATIKRKNFGRIIKKSQLELNKNGKFLNSRDNKNKYNKSIYNRSLQLPIEIFKYYKSSKNISKLENIIKTLKQYNISVMIAGRGTSPIKFKDPNEYVLYGPDISIIAVANTFRKKTF